MKKFFTTFVFSLIAIVAFAFVNDTEALTASAVNDLSVSVTKLTTAEEDAQVGDYKVTLSIAENSGLSGLGIGFYYDSTNFAPVMTEDNTVSFISMTPLLGFSVMCSPSNSVIGVAAASPNNCRKNGDLVSFYLRKTSNVANAFPLASIIIDQLTNIEDELLSYSISDQCAVYNVYRVGDANADGNILIYDAIFINQIISNANGVAITESNFMNYITSTNVGDGVCFALMDADGDGFLTSTDADIITQYIAGYSVNAPMLDYATVYITISAN